MIKIIFKNIQLRTFSKHFLFSFLHLVEKQKEIDLSSIVDVTGEKEKVIYVINIM